MSFISFSFSSSQTKHSQFPNMVPLEKIQTIPKSPEYNSSPRISFSADFLDDKSFISISPTPPTKPENKDKGKSRVTDFEFLSNNPSSQTMITADELFFEGKLLPFWQIQHIDKLSKINIKENITEKVVEEEVFRKQENNNNNNNHKIINSDGSGGRVWFIDDDPSPRPPKCTLLWKELLRLKKQRAASSLSPSSSSSSTSSAGLGDLSVIEEGKEGSGKKEKNVKRNKKGHERTRSASIRIRPMVNVPVCAQGKSNGLGPLFSSIKKGRLER